MPRTLATHTRRPAPSLGLVRASVLAASLLWSGCSLRRSMERTLVRKADHAGLEATVLHAGDVDLHYFRSTDPPAGRPLLIIHGFGGDALSNWSGQLEALAPVRPLLLPDLLWFGQSASSAEPTLRAQAGAMLAMLDHEEIPEVDIMAISYGGFVAFGMLELDPDRVGRLILVDTPGPLFSSADVQDMVERHGVDRADGLFIADGPEDLQHLFQAVMLDPPKLPGPVAKAMYAQWFSAHHDEQRALLADLPRQRMLLDHLPVDELPVPLVVWGAEDRIFPLSAGEALADALDAHLVVFHDAAHAPNFEQRKAFNDAVRAYLEAPDPQPGRTDVPPQ